MVPDTNVIAYSLIREYDLNQEATSVLEIADTILAPDSLRAELLSTVWQWVHVRRLPIEDGLLVLRRAEALVSRFVPTVLLWQRALQLAVEANHSPYDTLFVALAEAGFAPVPQVQELGVTPEHLELDRAFFGPVAELPLHLLFEAVRP